MSRTPPVSVREILRKEVNFGCPVSHCGSPYLEYHHFDPPWNEKHHHNPNGMIALCNKHHPEADNGAWEKEQLRELKTNPFVKGEIIGKFNWLRQDLLIIAGLVSHNPQVILRIGEEKTFWIEKNHNGYSRLNMVIRDNSGSIVLEIRNNDWLIHNDKIIDVVCPPSGKEITVHSKDKLVFLSVRFDDIPIANFKLRLESLWMTNRVNRNKNFQEAIEKEIQNQIKKGVPEKLVRDRMAFLHNAPMSDIELETRREVEKVVNRIGNPDRVTTCTVNASLEYPFAKIIIKDGVINLNNNFFSGFSSGGGTVYQIS